jgi:hypothetical protein
MTENKAIHISNEVKYDDNDIYLYNRDKYGFVQLDSNNNTYKYYKTDRTSSEWWLSDNCRNIFIYEQDTCNLYKLNIDTSDYQFVYNFQNANIYYVSDDTSVIVVGYNNSTEEAVLVNGQEVYRFNPFHPVQVYTSKYICYIDDECNLIKYNIVTGQQDYKLSIPKNDILLNTPILLDDTRLMIIKHDSSEIYSYYDTSNFELKYRIDDSIGKHDLRYIYCYKSEDTGIKKISLYDIKNGKHVISFKTYAMAGIEIAGDIISGYKIVDGEILRSHLLIYSIYGKFIGNIELPESSFIYRKHISPNNNYLYVTRLCKYVDNGRTSSLMETDVYDISDLFNRKRKLEFLKGKDSPESSIARTATDPLFDEHLFGEIFAMIGATLNFAKPMGT